MFLYDNFTVNGQNHLEIDGVDTVELAKSFGTPLYVMSQGSIERACKNYHEIMSKHFGAGYKIAYASKAFSARFIYDIMKKLNMNIDVVSGGEMYTAITAGYDPGRIHFHGGNKTDDEIKYAIDNNVLSFVVDCYEEIEAVNQIAGQKGKKVNIIFRVKPGVDAHTHEFISTGHIDCKFGLGIEDGWVFKAIDKVLSCENLVLTGLHCHIGSQIFLAQPYYAAGQVMLELFVTIREKYGITLKELIIGGGFGIKYTYEDEPGEAEDMIGMAAKAIKEVCCKASYPMPEVTIEPGRSIVGPAGITLYTVGGVKEIENVRNYVSIDGGMTDNPRFALYGATYEAVVCGKAGDKRDFKATIAGKCCESGDLVTRDIFMQKPERGDTVATFSTGAYNFSMFSNYNKALRPAVVLVNDGKARCVVKRECFEDLTRLEL